MKAAAICALLLLAFAYNCQAQSDATCDPDAKGTPDCATDAAGNYRNNWDPTHYFVCSGGQVEEVACPTAELYDPTSKSCISWTEWNWESPCPQNSK